MFQLAAVLFSILSLASAACNSGIIRPWQWGGKNMTCNTPAVTPFSRLVILQTDNRTCTSNDTCADLVRTLQLEDINNYKLDDLRYNYLISPQGDIFAARGLGCYGQHTEGFNNGTAGIAVIGSFDDTAPTDAAMNSLRYLIACGNELKVITYDNELYGQKDLLCASGNPGAQLYSVLQVYADFPRYKGPQPQCTPTPAPL